jgi:hypothetical protein
VNLKRALFPFGMGLAAIAACFYAAPVRAEILGNDLYHFCVDGREGSHERDVCTAFILGVLKGLDYGAMNLTKKPCFANYVPPTQAELIVKKFMTDHPELLGYDAGMVATMALIKAFGGCQPRATGGKK